MYDNVGQKLKTLAKISAILGIAVSVIFGLLLFDGYSTLGLLIILIGPLVSWVSSLATYAFGEMHVYLENICGCCQSVAQAIGDNSVNYYNRNKSWTNITIPEGITSIDYEEFADYTLLTRVTIPNSVTSIAGYAFYNCNSLKEIHYNGTIEQWTGINKAKFWNNNTSNYTVYCTDGKFSK